MWDLTDDHVRVALILVVLALDLQLRCIDVLSAHALGLLPLALHTPLLVEDDRVVGRQFHRLVVVATVLGVQFQ